LRCNHTSKGDVEHYSCILYDACAFGFQLAGCDQRIRAAAPFWHLKHCIADCRLRFENLTRAKKETDTNLKWKFHDFSHDPKIITNLLHYETGSVNLTLPAAKILGIKVLLWTSTQPSPAIFGKVNSLEKRNNQIVQGLEYNYSCLSRQHAVHHK
jgi:hypothetical protein